jgi:hypothetical protein
MADREAREKMGFDEAGRSGQSSKNKAPGLLLKYEGTAENEIA